MKEVAARRRRPVRAVDRRVVAAEVRAFASASAIPLIVKPRDGAGASGAVPRRLATPSSSRALPASASGCSPAARVAVEEFIEGHEGFYDTLTVDGEVVPRVRLALLPERARGDAHALDLAAVHRHEPHRQRPRLRRGEGDGAEGDRGCSASTPRRRTWSGSSGPKGLKFCEIGCRPPGVRAWDLYDVGNDMDLYREWAMLVAAGPPSQRPSRRFSAGHHRAASRARRAHRRLRRPRRGAAPRSATASSTGTCRRGARRRSRSRPATWRTRGSA